MIDIKTSCGVISRSEVAGNIVEIATDCAIILEHCYNVILGGGKEAADAFGYVIKELVNDETAGIFAPWGMEKDA